MSGNKVWNLMYVLGATERVVSDSDNPQGRTSAVSGGLMIEKNGWRAWVEHYKTSERIFESRQEQAYRQAAPAKRLVQFVVDDAPGYVSLRPR